MVRRLHGLNQESSRLAERAGAVRVLIVAWKRVTTVERRGIERWTGLDESGLRTPERVPSRANHSGQGLGGETVWMPKPALTKTSPVAKAPARGNGRGPREPLRGVRPFCQTVAALSLQSRTGSLTCGHPPIGEPDAGAGAQRRQTKSNLHVRFGGRGGASQCAIPTSIQRVWRTSLRLPRTADFQSALKRTASPRSPESPAHITETPAPSPESPAHVTEPPLCPPGIHPPPLPVEVRKMESSAVFIARTFAAAESSACLLL